MIFAHAFIFKMTVTLSLVKIFKVLNGNIKGG